VPAARSEPGFRTSLRALFFLRAVARAAHLEPSQVDCRAVGQFYRFFRGLGANTRQALALRAALLRNRNGPLARPRLPDSLTLITDARSAARRSRASL
jgi:hypothetical protein